MTTMEILREIATLLAGLVDKQRKIIKTQSAKIEELERRTHGQK